MKKEVSDALHFLLHCSLKDTRFTTQKEQFDIVYEELVRLNNIINELEKWLVEEQNLTCGCGITRDYLYAFDECLDKLQELKGSDEE